MNIDWTWFLIGLAVGYLAHGAIGSVVGKARGTVGA